jgi:toxin ParE1/3/4
MTPRYSRRALADLNRIAAYYALAASPGIAEAVEKRLSEVVDRICKMPHSAPRLSQRSEVRAVSVVRYPFRIFYRVQIGTVEIIHIRHTSQRPALFT